MNLHPLLTYRLGLYASGIYPHGENQPENNPDVLWLVGFSVSYSVTSLGQRIRWICGLKSNKEYNVNPYKYQINYNYSKIFTTSLVS